MSERDRTLSSYREYDRSRLLRKNVVAEPVTTLREVTWEHQQAAIKAGYNSVLEMAVDQLHDAVRELTARIEALENPGCELVHDGDE